MHDPIVNYGHLMFNIPELGDREYERWLLDSPYPIAQVGKFFLKYHSTKTEETSHSSFWNYLLPQGESMVVFFPNGYGASVVRNQFSYGHETNLWELAVLKDGDICYTSNVTSDMVGFLTLERVEELLEQIYLISE